MRGCVLLDRFRQRRRTVSVYLSTPERCPGLNDRNGDLLGITHWNRPGSVRIILNAKQSPVSLETTYLHELCHLVTDRLGLTDGRDEAIAECVEELTPILRRYALRLPWSKINAAKKRLARRSPGSRVSPASTRSHS